MVSRDPGDSAVPDQAQFSGGHVAVALERRGAIAIARMEWPERRNALRPEDADQIRELLQAERSAGAVVLCGGPLAFCAGADLRRIAEVSAEGENTLRRVIYQSFQGLTKAIRDFPGIVISAVDGPALGLGADIALICDICYVGKTGWIQQGWANIGAVPGTGGAWITRRRAGSTAAWQFVMDQRRWSGPELQAAGLATYVDGMAENFAVDRAEWITNFSVDVAQAYKSLFIRADEESYEVHLERCGSYQARIVTTPEHRRRSSDALTRKENDNSQKTAPQ
jgi:enoyl-CoA hydratase/carnithine racemase